MLTEIKLNWYQDKFIFSKARYCALICGVGTGKTFSALLKCWKICVENPGSLGMVVRKEFEDLRDSTMADFEKYFGVRVNQQKKEYTFPNGSKIIFRHGNTNDINVLKNLNLSFFYIEQAEEYESEEVFVYLCDRLRRHGGVRCGFIVANMDGDNWIYRRFIDGATKHIHDGPTGQIAYEKEDSLCCLANSFANAHNLPADYVDSLRKQAKDHPKHYGQFVANDPGITAADDLLLPGNLIELCSNNIISGVGGVRFGGLDVSRYGDNKTVLDIYEAVGAYKCRQVETEVWQGQNTMYSAGRTLDAIKRFGIKALAVDCDGLGAGVYDRLAETVKGCELIEFRGGFPANDKEQYNNRRSECYFNVRNMIEHSWLQIKNPETLSQLRKIKYDFPSSGIKYVVGKDVLRRKGIASPDHGDACMMGLSVFDVALKAEQQQGQYFSEQRFASTWV